MLVPSADDRHDFGERMRAVVMLDERQQPGLGDEIDLAEHENHRRLHVFQRSQGDSDRPGPVFTDASTTSASTSTSRIASSATSTMRTFIRWVGLWTPACRRTQPGPGVPSRIVLHADDTRSRRLRLVRHDGELLADDAIEQRGLAGVRAANERDETRFHMSTAGCLTGRLLCSAAAAACVVARGPWLPGGAPPRAPRRTANPGRRLRRHTACDRASDSR